MSSYRGYLLKIGTYTFPRNKIKAESYHAYVNSQDYEPWTDAKGYLHRDAVDLKALKVEFDTVAMMNDTELDTIMAGIYGQMTSQAENRVVIEAYIPQLRDYVTQTGYMVDIDPTMYYADDNKIQYEPIHFTFIGGVATET